MILKNRIPQDFYKLFRTKNRDSYEMLLIAVYDADQEVFAALGLTEEECRSIISDTIALFRVNWMEDAEEDAEMPDLSLQGASPSGILLRLERWGWLVRDYDEKLNTYIVSFPEYSQLYIELFRKLRSEDDSRERASILSVYSALFTYHADQDKNADILSNALTTSQNLSQLLSNMHDSMRSYFEELSGQKDFLGIQEVLVNEINNSDSRKYAILTTTDSFYRYKEAVKELVSQILHENDDRRLAYAKQKESAGDNTLQSLRAQRGEEACDEVNHTVYAIEREFNMIERKYNRLIEQKSIFAQRALARMHYIMNEGADDENNLEYLIRLCNKRNDAEEIIDGLRGRMKFSKPFSHLENSSFYNRKDRTGQAFAPAAVQVHTETGSQMGDFVPRPLYTGQELRLFRQKNSRNGTFMTDETTVQNMEDLEKLLFVWQETTENAEEGESVTLGADLHNEKGLTFSQLKISAHDASKQERTTDNV